MIRQLWIDVRARAAALFGRRWLDARADEELRFHLGMLEQRLCEAGLPRAEARRLARRRFGNVTRLRELTLDSWRYAVMETFFRDLRYGVRFLLRSRGFSVTAIAILAVAIGASTAIFSAFDALVLRPLPYPDPGQLVRISENFTRFEITGMQVSPPELDDLRAMTRSYSHIAGIRQGLFTLTVGETAEGVSGLGVSASIFPLLGVTPILGSPFRTDEEEFGKHHVVVLSEGFWRRRFGADPAIVGTSIEINREKYRVVAVSPPMLGFLGTAWDLWVPLSFSPNERTPASRGAKGVEVIARLKTGVDLAAATRELTNVGGRLAELHPAMYSAMSGFSLQAEGLVSRVAGNIREPLLFLLAAVGVLMLIACANVANLLIARASARRKEISVRVALGAGRARVVGQLMTESLVLAAVAGATGVALAYALLRLFERYGPRDLVPVDGVGINGWVVAFAIGVSLVASVLFGLIPALTAGTGLSHVLAESARGGTAGRRRFRESMVALQVAASVVLLICAGLLVQSFLRVQRADPGFDATNVLTFDLRLPVSQYAEPERRSGLYEALRSRLRSVAGVVAVGAVDRIPFGGIQGGATLHVVGRPMEQRGTQPMLRPSRILPGYFEALGVRVLRGRSFAASDATDTPPVAIIDEAAAERFFPDGEDPIGRQITGVEPGLTSTIVGVVGSVKRRDLALEPEMSVYHSAAQAGGLSMTFTVKTATDPLTLVPAIRHELAQIDPLLPLTRISTMEQRVSDSLARRRLSMQLIVFFGAAALSLAAIGLYGVLAYVVNQRRREVGIRVALGAQPMQVVHLVVARQGLFPVTLGMIAGLLASIAAARLLTAGLFEISPTDPSVYAMVAGLLVLTALAAIAIPARRAATLDPVVALREE
jgi:putative ABC transport system permease protein